MRFLFPALVFVAGCPPAVAPKDTAVLDTCSVTQVTSLPSHGSADAYYRGNIEFKLDAADFDATITTDIAGTHVPSEDGMTHTWVIAEPLVPNTMYEATLKHCGGDAAISFTTSPLGEPMEDPASLVDSTYVLALQDARIVEPAGIGALLSSYLTVDILVGITEVDGDSVQMLGAVGVEDADPPAQDYCNPSIDFPAADFSEQPYFAIGPQATTISVGGIDVTIDQLFISGTFAADGSYFGGGVLSGTIDTRPLDSLVGDDAEEGAVCDLAPSFGVECVACGDGQPFCLTLVADSIQAERVDGVVLVAVAGDDCEGCETGPPAEDAVCEESE